MRTRRTGRTTSLVAINRARPCDVDGCGRNGLTTMLGSFCYGHSHGIGFSGGDKMPSDKAIEVEGQEATEGQVVEEATEATEGKASDTVSRVEMALIETAFAKVVKEAKASVKFKVESEVVGDVEYHDFSNERKPLDAGEVKRRVSQAKAAIQEIELALTEGRQPSQVVASFPNIDFRAFCGGQNNPVCVFEVDAYSITEKWAGQFKPILSVAVQRHMNNAGVSCKKPLARTKQYEAFTKLCEGTLPDFNAKRRYSDGKEKKAIKLTPYQLILKGLLKVATAGQVEKHAILHDKRENSQQALDYMAVLSTTAEFAHCADIAKTTVRAQVDRQKDVSKAVANDIELENTEG